jgi:tetratricopeptide (TPR) repeat protein
MVQVRRMKADYDIALAHGREALAIAAQMDDRALEVAITHRVGQVHYALGDFSQAAAQLRRNVKTLESGAPDPGRYYGIASRAWLALALSTLGEFAEGVRHGAEALRLASGEATGASPVIVHGCLGLLYLNKGDLEAGVLVLERGLALCRATGDRDWARWTAAGLGHAYALVGRVAEGRALLNETLTEDLRTGASNAYADHLVRSSVACLLAGSLEDSQQHAHQALDLARKYRERGYEALALHQLGDIHAHADPTDGEAAEHHYRQALALSRELGMRPLVARCHLALGTLSRRNGNQQQAEEHLATATTMFREMEMHFWMEKAAAEMAELSVRDVAPRGQKRA